MQVIFLFLLVILSNPVFSQIPADTAMSMEKAFERDWIRYLERKIDLNVPIENGCKSGTFKVVIQFRIDKKGNVSDVTALTNNGFGMEELVSEIIKKGPGWIPVIHKSNHQSLYKTQPVIFVFGDGRPDNSKLINVTSAPGLLKEVTLFTSH